MTVMQFILAFFLVLQQDMVVWPKTGPLPVEEKIFRNFAPGYFLFPIFLYFVSKELQNSVNIESRRADNE